MCGAIPAVPAGEVREHGSGRARDPAVAVAGYGDTHRPTVAIAVLHIAAVAGTALVDAEGARGREASDTALGELFVDLILEVVGQEGRVVVAL